MKRPGGRIRPSLAPSGTSEGDRAVARDLTAKFRLGLFANPYVDPGYAERLTNSPEHRKLALKADVAIAVVGENEGANREAGSGEHLGGGLTRSI